MNSCEPSASSHIFINLNHSDRNTIFVTDSECIGRIDVKVFLLLHGFGSDSHSIVSEFVANRLARGLFSSAEFVYLVAQMASEEGTKWTQRTTMDDQMCRLIREIFVRVDNAAYETALEQLLEDSKEEQSQNRLMASGCSAILALFIGPTLFVANCGNAMGIYCKDGSDGVTTIRVSEVHERPHDQSPYRCFGNYGKKTEMAGKCVEEQSSADPAVQHRIELDYSARFLLLVPAPLWRTMQKLCPENQSLDGAIATWIAEAAFTDDSPCEQSIRNALTHLRETCEDNHVGLSLALIDLHSDMFKKVDFDGMEDGALYSEGEQREVASEVDWSEFDTHHLKEEVLAKIASLRQLYRERRTLRRISED